LFFCFVFCVLCLSAQRDLCLCLCAANAINLDVFTKSATYPLRSLKKHLGKYKYKYRLFLNIRT
jgi:hypothetical protein